MMEPQHPFFQEKPLLTYSQDAGLLLGGDSYTSAFLFSFLFFLALSLFFLSSIPSGNLPILLQHPDLSILPSSCSPDFSSKYLGFNSLASLALRGLLTISFMENVDSSSSSGHVWERRAALATGSSLWAVLQGDDAHKKHAKKRLVKVRGNLAWACLGQNMPLISKCKQSIYF